MREAKEREGWASLNKKYAGSPARPFAVGSSSIDLAAACTVISGKNGTGKSRLLREINTAHPDSTVLLNMHHLCELTLAFLRTRADLDEMATELGSQGPDKDRLSDIEKIVGREYESVEWYGLEISPTESGLGGKFPWPVADAEEPPVPFFRVQYRSVSYTSKDMGLGEFSMHFLFWILEQFRDTKDLTLLLDEPDAYLPPIGVEHLLTRLLSICLRRQWRVIISTHSEEMIAQALEEKSLTVLRVDDTGGTVALHSATTPDVAAELLSRPPIDRVLFVEDESAWYLTRALLKTESVRLSRATWVVWGEGEGYIRELHKSLPRPGSSELKFGLVLDGDQRGSHRPLDRRWPVVFLPTSDDPDTLFRAAARDSAKLADRLGEQQTAVQLRLDAIEGNDPHDWVNKLGDSYGRQNVLAVLASLWVEANHDSAAAFAADLEAGWNGSVPVSGLEAPTVVVQGSRAILDVLKDTVSRLLGGK